MIFTFITVSTLAPFQSLAQSPATGSQSPRPALELLFSEDDLSVMRENARLPIFETYWAEVLEADAMEDHNFMREAFIYQITGDPDRGRTAKRLMLETAEMEHWNNFVDGDLPLGFLTAGRLTAWMALGYDWLYDLLSEEERAAVRQAIAEKGCVPLHRALYGFRHPETVKGWAFAPYSVIEPKSHIDMTRWPYILAHNNFRAIINGGLTLGLLAVDGHDERVEEWKEIVLDSIVLFNRLLKDDGSYDEAVAYLNYAMTYQVYAMEAARRKLGVDFFDTANFQGMIDYVLAMYLPSHLYGHGSLTFGDAGNSLLSSTSFWVARNARDGLAQHVGLNYSAHDLFSLLYYDPAVSPLPPPKDSHLVQLDLDWIVSRSGYDLDDFVVGMRSGPPMNHEHGDRNSIQLKAYGEILLADHRTLTYWSGDPEWTMRTSLGHNMVLIDGVGVQYHNGEEGTNESKSHARIVRAGERPGYHFWTSDATQGYQLLNPNVRSVTRSIIAFPDAPAIVVLDKVVTDTAASRISTRWHVEDSDGQGALTVDDGSFTIARPHARLYAAVSGDSNQDVTSGRFDSENKKYPFIFAEV
ncbi:MAG TPA: heparinase II/III family protein, partial [Rhodothermia bacterium]|nr:heparinase II/III family protein [Rhodothermia bacterium]